MTAYTRQPTTHLLHPHIHLISAFASYCHQSNVQRPSNRPSILLRGRKASRRQAPRIPHSLTRTAATRAPVGRTKRHNLHLGSRPWAPWHSAACRSYPCMNPSSRTFHFSYNNRHYKGSGCNCRHHSPCQQATQLAMRLCGFRQ